VSINIKIYSNPNARYIFPFAVISDLKINWFFETELLNSVIFIKSSLQYKFKFYFIGVVVNKGSEGKVFFFQIL